MTNKNKLKNIFKKGGRTMLQIISHYISNEQELNKYETANHEEAFEYLPLAKGHSYAELADGEPVSFLAIRITANNGEEEEAQLLANNTTANMKVLSALNRMSSEFTDDFEFLSISYKTLKTKSEGVLVNALISTSDGEPILEYVLKTFTVKLKQRLNIKLDEEEKALLNEVADEADRESLNEDIYKNVYEDEDVDEEAGKEKPQDKALYTDVSNLGYEEKVKSFDALSADLKTDNKNEDENVREYSDELSDKLPKKVSAVEINEESVSKIAGTNPFISGNFNTSMFKMFRQAHTSESVKDTDAEAQPEKAATKRYENNKINNNEKSDVMRKTNNENMDKLTDIIYSSLSDTSDKAVSEQKKIYEKTSPDIPFLDEIGEYIPENDIKILEISDPVYELHEEDYGVKTTASEQKIRTSFEKTVSYFMENENLSLRRTLIGEKDEKDFMEDVRMYVDKYHKIPEEDKELFIRKCQRAFFSYYVLTPAILDPDVSDIRVLAPDNINVKVHGRHYTAKGIKFINEADYNRFIEALVIRNRVSIDHPIIVFTDKDFNEDYILRFNLCLSDINSTGMPYLHIRKVPKKKVSVTDLINAGMMDKKTASYILDKVVSAKGIVFAGPSASGKTTAMNAFIDYIPKDKSILCIQESEELFSHIHPNAYFQHMLKDRLGNTLIGLSQLGQNGLLCDSGYFIIGECKGGEVRDLLRASNTGHKCWCSVHSQSTKETIPRLADYVKYGSDYSLTEATRMLKDLEVIIYIENFKITEITEITGYDEDKKRIIYKSIYKRKE